MEVYSEYSVKQWIKIILFSLTGLLVIFFVTIGAINRIRLNGLSSQIDDANKILDTYEPKALMLEMKELELRRIEGEKDKISEMLSYSGIDKEVDELSSILDPVVDSYSISFGKVELDKDQVRRHFTVSYYVSDRLKAFDTMNSIFNSKIRNIVYKIKCNDVSDEVYVELSGVYMETMYDGVMDSYIEQSNSNKQIIYED